MLCGVSIGFQRLQARNVSPFGEDEDSRFGSRSV